VAGYAYAGRAGCPQLSRKVGYLRIWTFDLDDHDAFITELIRLLALLPPTGLIVDLRANPGGLIWAAERAPQLFTDVQIQPTRFSVIATPLTRQMADSPFNRLELEVWSQSLQDAVSTGELYSSAIATDGSFLVQRPGRKYRSLGAVVDANTYSSGSFAAGWVDHGIGPLVSVGQATVLAAGERGRQHNLGCAVWHRSAALADARRDRLHHCLPARDSIRCGRWHSDRGSRHTGDPVRDVQRGPDEEQ
jgi:hypothetical protein